MPEGNTPSTPGSNKMWYVIGGIVILALVGWFLMRGAGSLLGAASGVDVDRSLDGSTTYTDQEGNTATVGGTSMPENWPADAPQNFAGASIQYSGNSNPQTGTAGAAVVYTANASAQAVVDYYKAQLTSGGWTIAGSVNTGGATVLSATKEGRTFGVYIVPTGSGSVTVTAGLELQ